MNRPGHQLSWKERATASSLETEQDIVEGDSTGTLHNEMSVVWASSQGGCGPLKELLKNVEETVLQPPTQPRSPLLSGLTPATSRNASPFQGQSQSSASSSSLTSSTLSNGVPSASSSRLSRRTRSATSRFSYKPVPSSSTHAMKPEGIATASQISTLLSRVSRSLNEKAMSEYTLSQRRRMSQTQAVKPPSHRKLPQPKNPPPELLQIRTAGSPARTRPKPSTGTSSEQTRPAELMDPSSSTGPVSHRTTAMKDSPRKVRIKALLETIDHSDPFPGAPSISSTSALHSNSRQPTFSNKSSFRPQTLHDVTSYSPPRRTLALGMRRPVLQSVVPQGPTQANAASAVLKLPSSQQTPNHRAGNPLASITIDRTDQMVVVDTKRNDDKKDIAQKSHHGIKSQRLSRGYRTSSPPLRTPVYISEFLSLDEDVEMKGNLDDRFDNEEQEGDLGEDTETNMSDGASSGNSSYGDIGIDAAALEEVCKVYDT